MDYDIDAILKMDAEAAEKEQWNADAAEREERIIWLPIDDLVDFPQELHKFKPATGQRLRDLEESIRLNGILNAILVRKLPNGSHQIIAGHNRRTAGRNIGYSRVPCIIKQFCNDDDAIRAMIADNLNNRELLPSERGWAYQQELNIRKRQAGRPAKNSSHCGTNFRTDDLMGIEQGVSKSKIHRYIRLMWLTSPLLELVDQQKIGLGTGEQLSYLKQRSQETVYNFCYASEKAIPLKEAQARTLREVEADPDRIIDEDLLEELTAPRKKARLRTLKIEMAKLRDYFPTGTPEEVVLQTIHTALAVYFEEKQGS